MFFVQKFAQALLSMALVIFISNVAQAQTESVETPAPAAWINRIKLFGDFRMRFQHDLVGSYTSSPAGSGNSMATSDYMRIAARLGARVNFTDKLIGVTRMSTGTRQVAPFTSLGTNNYQEQSGSGALGTGFSDRRDFFLDLAYLNYNPDDSVVVQLGKMPVIYWTPGGSMLVWNLFFASEEGAQAKWVGDYGSWHPFATAGVSTGLNRVDGSLYSSTAANSTTDGPPIMMLGCQVGLTWTGKSQWVAGDIASYSYNNIAGTQGNATGMGSSPAATSGIPTGSSTTQNNSVDSTGRFKYDYALVNLGLEYGYKFSWGPAKIYADYVQNTMTGSDNVGVELGIVLGKLVDQGDLYLAVNYRDVRRDSVVGAYADTTFFAGGTDALGTDIEIGYQYWARGGFLAVIDYGRKYISYNYGQPFETYFLDIYASF